MNKIQQKHKDPFSSWVKQFNKRFKKNSEFFDAVFDFTDMKREKSKGYKK